MRPDLDLVAGLIDRGSHVIDLGCGDGALLARLMAEKDATGYGIERASEGFHACIARGVPVIQGDLEVELERLGDGVFDHAVLSLTLQATQHPAGVLAGMGRVARRSIVSLPNIGHWRHRSRLAVRGLMPVGGSPRYEWFESPNIHLCTLRDFEALLGALDLRVVTRLLLSVGGEPAPARAGAIPNLLAAGAVYLIERTGAESR